MKRGTRTGSRVAFKSRKRRSGLMASSRFSRHGVFSGCKYRTKFAYDGWNLIGEVAGGPGSTPAATNYYVWGLDLSGTLQGAGGVGGLLYGSFGGTTSVSSVFYAYDANGNVGQLLDASNSTNILAHYEYSPFGEIVVSSGPMAAVNPFRFSTKYWDAETKTLAYQFRDYGPGMGKWLSKDPLLDPGNVTVMIIREVVLDVLRRNIQMALEQAFNANAPAESRQEAIDTAYRHVLFANSLANNEPDFWIWLAGDNWNAFCGDNPVNFTDPFGLATYRQNRVLAILEPQGTATRAPITHTFVFTTNPNGTIKHTYSWGNDEGHWYIDRPNDLRAAKQAMCDDSVRGDQVGGDDLDPFIDQVYYDWENDPTHIHPNRWVYNNCKTEAGQMIGQAQQNLSASQTPLSPLSPGLTGYPGFPGY